VVVVVVVIIAVAVVVVVVVVAAAAVGCCSSSCRCYCCCCLAKELGVPQIGSFRCLYGKVDLSTYEAEHTVDTWQGKLQKLRQELAVRTIAKNITSTPAPYTVKVLAYENGRNIAPQLVIGSSIAGVCFVVVVVAAAVVVVVVV